ncbi:molybdenum cofactor guanylyltransferase [Agromyces sp. SYSU T0242]|uniref:molybdenum cofactor guanylyltransferase n=1 Tax=Agromyces litoreus TaxID=3158561 RepID=UPI00339505F5
MSVVDAVILMGGRAERLGGIVKGDLRVEGGTILERVVEAAEVARTRVVVGDAGASRMPDGIRVVREHPAHGGPAAAVAAGVAALDRDGDAVLVLAGDQPFIAEAVGPLLAALHAHPEADGIRAVDAHGRAQHLASVVRRAALESAIASATAGDRTLDGASMRDLFAAFRLIDTAVPIRATMDVDTWADAEALGATGGATR